MPTTSTAEVISFNPAFQGDTFIWINHWLDQDVVERLSNARAVVLPQALPSSIYSLVKATARAVFPNYDARFRWEGKVGAAFMCWQLGIPHPRTWVFPRVESFVGDHAEMGKPPFAPPAMPFVIKASTKDEGRGTWLIQSDDDLEKALDLLALEEMAGRSGFVLQEYLAGLEKTLRVVVIGSHVEAYWRVAPPGSFYSNVSRGAEVVAGGDEELKRLGVAFTKRICHRTGINLAGFDVCFVNDSPMLLEINYTFGLSGIGGWDRFCSLFAREVSQWLSTTGAPGPPPSA